MTISGGQILHKAGYPRITFPRIQKMGARLAEISVLLFSFTGTSRL